MMSILCWSYIIFAAAVTEATIGDDVQNKIEPLINLCPPSGNIGTEFVVKVLGTEFPQISGYVFKQRNNRIDIWLENNLCDGGVCKSVGTEHMNLDCVAAWHAIPEDNKGSKFVYLTFFDRMYYKKQSSKYRCAMYAQDEINKSINLAVNEGEDCSGLKERLLKTPVLNTTETPEWINGFLLLHLSPKLLISLPTSTTKNKDFPDYIY